MLNNIVRWGISKLQRGFPMVNSEKNVEVFHFDQSKKSFDDMGYDNDIRYWHARDLMGLLGYESYTAFRAVINKAISACASLNVSIIENFIETQDIIDGKNKLDFKLSRFACY